MLPAKDGRKCYKKPDAVPRGELAEYSRGGGFHIKVIQKVSIVVSVFRSKTIAKSQNPDSDKVHIKRTDESVPSCAVRPALMPGLDTRLSKCVH
jgi:hypothetical protein